MRRNGKSPARTSLRGAPGGDRGRRALVGAALTPGTCPLPAPRPPPARLVYWVVYSAFSIIESFSDLVFTWIPMYFPFKIAFLCWCFLPQTRGAHVLYNNFLKDFLKAHESAIDAQINRLSGGLVAAGKDD